MQATTIEDERRRVEDVVEALATAGRNAAAQTAGTEVRERVAAGPAALCHDFRNMVTALSLYCQLLEEPGVLTENCVHYARDLRVVAEASQRLVERLMAVLPAESARVEASPGTRPAEVSTDAPPIDDLAAAIEANHNLLDAIAGMGVAVSLHIDCGAGNRSCAVRMTDEDLTRVLVNLVRNATEAMHGAGRLRIELTRHKAAGQTPWLKLAVEDSGPGIPEMLREAIFAPGYSTHPLSTGGWAGPHRGLGLSICRSLAEAAGGRMIAARPVNGGARFEIELPVDASRHSR